MQDETSTNSTVTQKNLSVGGDNAGGDVNKPTYNISTATGDTHAAVTFVARLTKKYREEKEKNATFRQTVEKLEHYQTPASGEPILTLEEKLQKGGREDLINFALRTKEMFTKKLAKHSLFESAQEINAFLLAEVFSRYHEFVYPHVCKSASIEAVNALVRTHIIDPLLGILGENVLGHYSDDINGMLYFLTGNCHIKWIK